MEKIISYIKSPFFTYDLIIIMFVILSFGLLQANQELSQTCKEVINNCKPNIQSLDRNAIESSNYFNRYTNSQLFYVENLKYKEMIKDEK